MIETINGITYREMMDYGIRNLTLHCDILNSLNVFPVPDGDTGTNMVMTLQSGLDSIRDTDGDLASVAQKFASAILFGARGNSGVIASQFFRGISERFYRVQEADVALLTEALENGVKNAYAAVARPVEGTVLTVIREGTQAVKKQMHQIGTINEAIDIFTKQAKEALENTPNLLPVLKDAGVVDSGGAGIVYFFEGVKKYLDGEVLEGADQTAQKKQITRLQQTAQLQSEKSLSCFGNGAFYGYCTECLLQLQPGKAPFEFASFREDLLHMGDSLVAYCQEETVRVHIHSFQPGQVIQYCQQYGEFLHIKIENMALQHTEKPELLQASRKNESAFAIVAVAADRQMAQTFLDMGADVVILSARNLSSKDFIQACERINATEIFIFPNQSNSVLAAEQMAGLYQKANITVLHCGDIAKCYASLAMMDFSETNMENLVKVVTETIENVDTVGISRSVKTMTFGDVAISQGDFIAMSGDTLLAADEKLETVLYQTVKRVMAEEERSVLTLFYNSGVSAELLETMTEQLQQTYPYLEVCTVPTQEELYDLSVSFE